jgi:hypothetical protein
VDHDQYDDRYEMREDHAAATLLSFEVDDAAVEIAAAGVGAIPTASLNMVPPNCCVQAPTPRGEDERLSFELQRHLRHKRRALRKAK